MVHTVPLLHVCPVVAEHTEHVLGPLVLHVFEHSLDELEVEEHELPEQEK